MLAPAISHELRRLDLLRLFKIRLLRDGAELLTPFSDRIATAHNPVGGYHLPALHADVVAAIGQEIRAVHDTGRSRVVLLSGEAGTGKSHVLRQLARPENAADLGIIVVGGSNDWDVGEFQPCLLDRMIQALTHPGPSAEGQLLLDRVRAIGFRALDQLLESRTTLRRCLARRRRNWLGRVVGRVIGRRPGYDRIERQTRDRDPEVFRSLDYARFSDEVCNRFLAEPGNLVHRYALRVLLAYLFPDDSDAGVGTRERVLHWFRRKADDGYWVTRLGVGEDLTARYAVADTIKLLVHLFSPELSARLAVNQECPPRVFVFAFDQAEGRDELFDSLDDWNLFFAHLSELYNTLPNVLVLFTMTLRLRNELHPKMERQFKDRIRLDERFTLRNPSPEQIRELYRARLDAWLADDPMLQGQYRECADVHLPFGPERVVEVGGTQAVRDVLERFDREFLRELGGLVIEPDYDFEFARNQHHTRIEGQSEHDFTADHLDTVRGLIEPLAGELAREYDGVRLKAIAEEKADTLRVLRLDFEYADAPATWVSVYLARLGQVYNPYIPPCEQLLFRRQIARYSVWMVRARKMDRDLPRPDQMFDRLIPVETEARLLAAREVLGKRGDYEAKGTWPAAWKLVRAEVANSYLGELFAHARDRVNAIRHGAVVVEPGEG